MSVMLDRLAAQLAPRPAPPRSEGRCAAVACVLDDDPNGPRVLMMKRVERAGDPWSGHISLPGGGYQVEDGDLLATAIRETREELGIELDGARLLGNLPPLHPLTSGPKGIEVTPFVFQTTQAVEPVCGPEALAAFWLPLDLAASGAINSQFEYASEPRGEQAPLGRTPTSMKFPAWTYEGHVIWGLTWRILSDLLALGR
jgi:8-oxo-dGTP pyrophosphatase MutT (NUDIX family)